MGNPLGVQQNSPATNNNPFLQIVLNPDGTLTRPATPSSHPSPQPPPKETHALSARQPPPPRVFSQDVPLNPAHDTWLRIYRPHHDENNSKQQKLPVVVFYHGGGFVLFSAATTPYHELCERMAVELPALVISLDYRLAPEWPLPAAYDDAVEAIAWLRQRAADPSWIRAGADFSRCFLMGCSSGGNIAYHAGRRAAGAAPDLLPLEVAGLILNQPYFGGVGRTPSELAMEDDGVLPLRAADMMWRLALPNGADRNHEFCNPVAAAAAEEKEKDRRGGGGGRLLLLPRCLVRGNIGDPLIDRQREFAEMLRERAAGVVGRLDQEGHHAVELFDPEKARELLSDVRDFIYHQPPPPPPPPPPAYTTTTTTGVAADAGAGFAMNVVVGSPANNNNGGVVIAGV